MAFLEILLAVILCGVMFLVLASKETLPWNWPFIKMMPTMYLESHKVYDKTTQMLSQNNGTILFRTSWISSNDILVTSDVGNVQHIMNSKFSIYQRGLAFKDVFDFLGDAAFNKSLDEWKEEKKITHAYFRLNDYHKTTPKIIHHTLEKGLIPILDNAAEKDQILDMQSLFNRYMLDATCILGTGFDPGSLRVGFPQTPLLNAMDDIAEAAFYRHILPEKVWKLQRFLNIGTEKKMVGASKTFDRILDEYVSKKQDSSASGPETWTDTSGALLTWFFWQISKNPEVKTKILQEIKQTCPHTASQKHIFSNLDELGKLVYLHSALSEALRIFPTAPFLLRVPNQEDVLPSGHKVNQDTKVMLCSYAMGRNPEIWGEDCCEFKPERWISDKGGIKHFSSTSFVVFGSGPWTCPGRELAFTRMKAVAATILHNFTVHISQGQSIIPGVSAILTMKHGLKVTVSKRWG
ncbi:hypothetical protein F511_08484 [Dorcoceras hygrometricum]|uniref:Cytochrome P450 n=1 Tax=Dorcoceras hygrometricum TaxID=472368 RepID=A0A2Z7AIV1_9LAMI|nr:hypothetical protein F511_08484 [Dorcoceras hygrometricum]